MAVPYSPIDVDTLYRQYMYGRITDDEDENKARTDYQSALGDLQSNRRRSMRDLAVNAADRGMTHAGPTLQTGLDTNAQYDKGQTQLGQTMASELARIAKKRLVDDSNYNMQRALY